MKNVEEYYFQEISISKNKFYYNILWNFSSNLTIYESKKWYRWLIINHIVVYGWHKLSSRRFFINYVDGKLENDVTLDELLRIWKYSQILIKQTLSQGIFDQNLDSLII